MKIELLQPDAPFEAPLQGAPQDDGIAGFAQALNAIGKVLTDATQAEDAYASGTGSLQEAMYQRAQADIALSVATAAAQRAAQAVQTVMNLQI